jgi:GNAT superfamily N-acetyltransferase
MQTIRMANEVDAMALPDIERSSGEAFRHIPDLAWIADDIVTSKERHEKLIQQGTAWVAHDNRKIITGFLTAELHQDVLHIWQMSVRSDQQRQGIGRNLIRAAELWARSRYLTALTLTTFRDVPWNAPFYRSCGFEIVNPVGYPILLAMLDAEQEAGLPIEQRCGMIWQL